MQQQFEEILEKLSKRRREVLTLMLAGQTDDAIADSLGIEPTTVRKHIERICLEFGVKKRTELLILFGREKPLLLSDALPVNFTPNKYYVERPELQERCLKQIKSGGMLRIKAPKYFGKTTLMNWLLREAQKYNYTVVTVELRMAEKNIFQNLNRFLQWFVDYVTKELKNLGLPIEPKAKLTDYWDDTFGTKVSCKDYFQNQILKKLPHPLVLAIDDVDMIYTKADEESHGEIYNDFLDMLRSWHEESLRRELWRKLILVLTCSRRLVITDINKSPFNVGLEIEIPELTTREVEVLAKWYELPNLAYSQIERLRDFLGGNPSLIEQGLKAIADDRTTNFDDFLKKAGTDEGIYSNYLRWLVKWLSDQKTSPVSQEEPLVKKIRDMAKNSSEKLDINEVDIVDSIGIIKIEEGNAKLRCDLYRDYFKR